MRGKPGAGQEGHAPPGSGVPPAVADAPGADPAGARDAGVLTGLGELGLLLDGDGRVLACLACPEPPFPAALLGPGSRLLDHVPAAHRATASAAIRDALRPGLAHTFDLPLAIPGGVRWHLARVGPADRPGSGGPAPAALLVALDITDRRREEARLRRAEVLLREIEAAADVGIWEWDPRDPHVTWSEHLYRIYGLDPGAHDPSYQDYLTRVHPEDRERVELATEAAFRDHRPFSHDERILRPDGEVRHLHTWAHPVVDDHGRLVRLVGVCQDVTDRLRQEEVLERARRQLEVGEKLAALGTLVSGVAHEVRTPLTYIHTYAALIRQEVARAADPALAADLARHAERINEGVDRITRLVDQMRRFAAPRLDLAPAGLDEVAAEAAEAFQVTRPGAVDLRLDLAPTPRLALDASQLQQVVLNLLNNAADAVAAGGRVELRTGPCDGGAFLEVADAGPGMTAEVQARLFDPFFTTKPQGTGLGLSISRRIVEAHGGRIGFESPPGRGATFRVHLPGSRAGEP